MTSLSLLLLIASGMALQLAICIGVRAWGYRSSCHPLGEPKSDQGLCTVGDQLMTPRATGAPFRNFRVDSKVIEDASRSICSFYLVPEDECALAPFLPGQFLTFRLNLPKEAGGFEELYRCYSLSDAPRSDYYRVTIKRALAPPGCEIPSGRSSNYFHDYVKVGSTLQVREPSGNFHIDPDNTPVVLIGGGIGITPMLSMVNWCLANQPGREVWLYYGVRNSREIATPSHLEELALSHINFQLRICLSNPLPDDLKACKFFSVGRIDIGLLRSQLPLKLYHFYICGPALMMESLVSGLEEWGVPGSYIHFEAFGPESVNTRNKRVPIAESQTSLAQSSLVVNFVESGKELRWPPTARSILEFAEANDIVVSSGCRSGSCGSCQTRLLSGEVEYSKPPNYQPKPGTCLLCIGTPRTNITLAA